MKKKTFIKIVLIIISTLILICLLFIHNCSESYSANDCIVTWNPPGLCDYNTKTRTRTAVVTQPQKPGGQPCPSLTKIEKCNPANDCQYTIPAGDTPGFCDISTKTRFRNIRSLVDALPGGGCQSQIIEKCDPVNDCIVTLKDKTLGMCDPATNTRTGNVDKVLKPRNISKGGGCGNMYKSEVCDPNNDCKLQWKEPETVCNPKTKTREINATVITKQNSYGKCITTKTEPCNPENDCIVTWTPPGFCDSKTKTRKRTAVVTQPQKPGGLPCPALTKVESCDPKADCDPFIAEWGPCDKNTNTQIAKVGVGQPATKNGGCGCYGNQCRFTKKYTCLNPPRPNESLKDWIQRNPRSPNINSTAIRAITDPSSIKASDFFNIDVRLLTLDDLVRPFG